MAPLGSPGVSVALPATSLRSFLLPLGGEVVLLRIGGAPRALEGPFVPPFPRCRRYALPISRVPLEQAHPQVLALPAGNGLFVEPTPLPGWLEALLGAAMSTPQLAAQG